VYLSIDHPKAIEEAFDNLGAGAADVDLIIATDAEQILGLRDWGVGGIEVSLGKLAAFGLSIGEGPSIVIATNPEGASNRRH
jgi:malate dehydrogenase (oxaloacetate-decarboxylating)